MSPLNALLYAGGGTAAQPANNPDRRSNEKIDDRMRHPHELTRVLIRLCLLLRILTKCVPVYMMAHLMIESLFDE
jgi:hypothetical protein